MHYYQFNISNFSQNTKHLSIIERGIYRELLDLYYDKELPLVNNPERLARLICASEYLTDVEQVLNEFFTLIDNEWVNNTCEDVISEYQKRLDTASKAGKASAKARANKLKASKEVTPVEQPLNEGATNYKLETNNYKLETTVISLPCKSSELFILEIDSEYHKQLAAAYKSKDIINEFNKMAIWLEANPKKLKTLNGMKGFITRWLSKKDKDDFDSKIPFDEIANTYNINFAKPLRLSDVASMTDSRKRSITAIWEFKPSQPNGTNSVEYFARYFAYCEQVDFLAGRKTDFQASIDYLLKQETYINILENNYRD